MTRFPAGLDYLSKLGREMCKKIMRTVVAVTDEESKEDFLHYLTYMGNGLSRYRGEVLSNVVKSLTNPSVGQTL